MTAVRAGWIEVGENRHAICEAGPTDYEADRLMFLPGIGIGARSNCVSQTVEELSLYFPSHRIIAIGNIATIGTVTSACITEYNLENDARLRKEILDIAQPNSETDPGRLVIIGQSLGGIITANLLAHLRESVHTDDSIVDFAQLQITPDKGGIFSLGGRFIAEQPALRRRLDNSHKIPYNEIISNGIALLRKQPAHLGTLLAQGIAVCNRPLSAELISGYHGRIGLLAGEDDKLTHVDTQAAIAEATGAEFDILPRGHELAFDPLMTARYARFQYDHAKNRASHPRTA